MKLVIAEKPSVAKVIANVIGANVKKDSYFEGNMYIVSWCIGHLIELDEPESYDEKYKSWSVTPIIPTQYKYKVKDGTKEQFNVLKNLMNHISVDGIICATDAGREGELIFRHTYQMAGCKKPFQRLWISSLEDESIKNGFKNLKNGIEYNNLYESALCREQADWLVGINATRYFTDLYQSSVLSIGRVQTPTLNLIVTRNHEIKNFIKEKYYTVEISNDSLTAVSDKIKNISEAQELQQKCNNQSATVLNVDKQIKSTNPPKLYDLTSLQRDSNRIFGYTAKQTLDAVQSLYDKKLSTYPRTDSQYITDDMEQTLIDIRKTILNVFGQFSINYYNEPNVRRCINNAKVSDHHAIIPTENIAGSDLSTLSDIDKNILYLVADRVLTATSDKHEYEKTTALIKCCDTYFTATGKIVKQNGYKDYENKFFTATGLKDTTAENSEVIIPELTENMTFNVNSNVKEHFTSPPKQYTEDTLLSAMERAGNNDYDTDDVERKGLGTPATRASIIETLITRNYVERKNKQLIPTEKGINLTKIIPAELLSAKLTAEWENRLTRIAKGTENNESFMRDITDFVRNKIVGFPIVENLKTLFTGNEKESIGTCPRCGSKIYEGKLNFYCENKDCNFVLWKNNKFFEDKKKNLTKATAVSLLKNGTVHMKGLYSSKKNTTYDADIILVPGNKGDKYVNFKLEFGGTKYGENSRKS